MEEKRTPVKLTNKINKNFNNTFQQQKYSNLDSDYRNFQIFSSIVFVDKQITLHGSTCQVHIQNVHQINPKNSFSID